MITFGQFIFTVVVVALIISAYFVGQEVGIDKTNKVWRKNTDHAANIRERESRRVA